MTVPVYAILDTWNAGGTSFTGIGLNVTDTASASDSKLLDLKVGGISKFTVQKDGTLQQPLLLKSLGVAAAGTSQGTASVITADIAHITSSSGVDAGVALPAAIVGRRVKILNETANRTKVYPSNGDIIGRNSVNASQYLLGYGTAYFECGVAGTWWPDMVGQSGTGTGQGLITTGNDANGQWAQLWNPNGTVHLAIYDNYDGFRGNTGHINGNLWLHSFNFGLGFRDGGNNDHGIISASGAGSGNRSIAIKPCEGLPTLAFSTAGRFLSTASAVNNILITNASTGNGPEISTEGTDSNIDLVANPKGTGNVRLGGGSWSANGSVATAMSSVGPTGSHSTVQEWLTVKNASGTLRYIPAF